MKFDKRDFVGATVVLTGAASGMGEQMAYQLAQEGAATLVLIDNQAEALAKVAATVAERGPAVAVQAHTCDVGNRAELTALGELILAEHPKLDLLINNAGVSMVGRFDEMTLDEFFWLTDINLRAPIILTHTLLPALKANPGSHIVNISSLFGLIAPAGQTPYCTSKFGLRGFSESLRVELASDGVGVTTIHPGGIRTRIAVDGRPGSGVDAKVAQASQTTAARLLRMPPEKAAQQILDGARHRKGRVVVGLDAMVLEKIPRLVPDWMGDLMLRAEGMGR